MVSSFYFVFLVLLTSTPPVEGKTEGFPQMTLLQQHADMEQCKKAIERLDLTPQEKEAVGCVRILKNGVHWVEA